MKRLIAAKRAPAATPRGQAAVTQVVDAIPEWFLHDCDPEIECPTHFLKEVQSAWIAGMISVVIIPIPMSLTP